MKNTKPHHMKKNPAAHSAWLDRKRERNAQRIQTWKRTGGILQPIHHATV